MTYILIPVQENQNAINEANSIMGMYNDYAQHDLDRFKRAWRMFWAVDRDQAYFQTLLDTLASNSYTDPATGTVTDALTSTFTKAKAEIADIERELPQAFDNARYEQSAIIAEDGTVTGFSALDPTGTPYREFITPGWYWTIEPSTGRFIVISPVVYKDPV